MKRSLLASLILLPCLVCGCKNKTYYVHIIKTNNTEHIDTIKATCDSAAYAKGYKYFMISEFTENIVKQEIQKNATPLDQQFYVKNKKGETIHFMLSDKAKSEMEQKAHDAIGGIASDD